MSFGDWELFRVTVLTLREREYQPQMLPSPNPQQSSAGQTNSSHQQAGNYHLLDVDYDGRLSRSSSLRSAVASGCLRFPRLSLSLFFFLLSL